MTDCLNRDIQVSQPDFCTHPETGETLTLYEWMSVRSAVPNYLKNNVLCGETFIEDLKLPNPTTMCLNNKPIGIEPYFMSWLTDVVSDPPTNTNIAIEVRQNASTTSPATPGGYQQYQWYPAFLSVCNQGIGVPPTNTDVDWNVSYQSNTDSQNPSAETIECITKECPGIIFPLMGYDLSNTLRHRILIKNISNIKLQLHVFFNCTVDLTGSQVPTPSVFLQVGVAKINKNTTEITPNDVFQNSTTNIAFVSTGDAYRVATDFLCELDNDEVIVPTFRYLNIPNLAEDNALVWQTCGLTAQIVGFCVDNLPPAQVIPPPTGPGV
jgi:hypothetical protein